MDTTPATWRNSGAVYLHTANKIQERYALPAKCKITNSYIPIIMKFIQILKKLVCYSCSVNLRMLEGYGLLKEILAGEVLLCSKQWHPIYTYAQ
jgi:hypothetical protein